MTMSHLECTREPTVKMCGAARPDNGHMEFGHSAKMGTPSAGVYIFSFWAACKWSKAPLTIYSLLDTPPLLDLLTLGR